jgi:hypothetical protein
MNDNSSELYVELCNQPDLYELHTHLLGMGNHEFWINTLTNRAILPTNDQFRDGIDLRRRLGPLVWFQNRFLDRQRTVDFFDQLRLHPNENFDGEDDEAITLRNLNTPELHREMEHRNLSFADNFSYDVIISMEKFAHAFSLSNPNLNIVQTTIEEKLGVYTHATDRTLPFKYWIIFNARKQKIEILYGMTAEKLRELIGGYSAIENIDNPAKRDARAHIINAFSMCNADGTMPRSIDYHSFRGQFTPEFYPRRFALKDSLYEQRLDILALLLQHVLRRYQTCFPPVKYCEFSVGVGDLSKAHVFDILRSFPSHDHVNSSSERLRENVKTAFHDIIEDFPWLTDKSKNEVKYRFLAGFDRQLVNLDRDTNNDTKKSEKQERAIQLLAEAPQLAIHYMLNEIIRSEADDNSKLFDPLIKRLANLEEVANKIPSFYDWVVGLDLCGDELGFPYCPFVAKEFIKHVKTQRKWNPNYGLRIHGGENVAVIHSTLPGYHLFVAHMYIVLLSIEYLKQKLLYGIRVGHGIAFNIIFNYDAPNESSSRKSSVLMAEMKELSRKILQNIPLEVNITSNVYLLGEAVRRGGIGEQTHSLECFFHFPRVPIVLSTDNDGVL